MSPRAVFNYWKRAHRSEKAVRSRGSRTNAILQILEFYYFHTGNILRFYD